MQNQLVESEIRHLKRFLISNLDLIQCQKEMLIANGKLIQDLKDENRILTSRLERMERRLLLAEQNLKNKSDLNNSLNLESNLRRSVYGDKLTTSNRDIKKIPKILFHKSLKIRKNLKKFQYKSYESSHKNSRKIKNQKKISFFKKDKKFCQERNYFNLKSSKNINSIIENKLYHKKIKLDDDILELDSYEDIKEINVPGWRILKIHTLYVMEGTENIDDMIFEKRHQKYENEEKKRKKWDLQRLRELNLLKKSNLLHNYDNATIDGEYQKIPLTFKRSDLPKI